MNVVFEFFCEVLFGYYLNILVGIVVCFELGDVKEVDFVVFFGIREIYGFNNKINRLFFDRKEDV